MSNIIFMYHSISNNGEKSRDFYSVPVNSFREQMEYVATSPCHRTVTSLAEEGVIITFDDGDMTNYTMAYPILKKLGLKAYFFIIPSRIGQAGHMGWEQIKELSNAGMMIGSHGMRHRILPTLSDKEIEEEFIDSKKILERKLRIPVEYLSIPRGFHNRKIIRKAKEAGYKAIFTSDLGFNTEENFNLYNMRRIPIKKSLSIDRFQQILDERRIIREKIASIFKKASQMLLGFENYEKLVLRLYK